MVARAAARVCGILWIMVSLSALAGAAAGLHAAPEKRVVVQGRVLSAEGQGMAGWPVHLIGTQRYVELRSYTSGGAVAELAGATTDENGYYSFDLPKNRTYQYWFVRFMDKAHLDPVRWITPDDVEVTSDIRRGRVAQVDMTIRAHPDWAEVKRMIAEAGGEGTQRGRILRTLGLPEKQARDEATGEEEWWYFTHGILYTFKDRKPTGSRRFEPVVPPPGGSAGGTR